MFNFLLEVVDSAVVDTPTNSFTGQSAEEEIVNNGFNAPSFLMGFLVGIVLILGIMYLRNSAKLLIKDKTNSKENKGKSE